MKEEAAMGITVFEEEDIMDNSLQNCGLFWSECIELAGELKEEKGESLVQQSNCGGS